MRIMEERQCDQKKIDSKVGYLERTTPTKTNPAVCGREREGLSEGGREGGRQTYSSLQVPVSSSWASTPADSYISDHLQEYYA